MPARCSHCGLRLERESGFYLGAIYFNYGITALTVAVAYPLLTFADHVAGQHNGSHLGLDQHTLASRCMTTQRDDLYTGDYLRFFNQHQCVGPIGKSLSHIRRDAFLIRLVFAWSGFPREPRASARRLMFLKCPAVAWLRSEWSVMIKGRSVLLGRHCPLRVEEKAT
jgi:hypothetical protein